MTTITSIEADSWNLSDSTTLTGPELVPVVQGEVVRTVSLSDIEHRALGIVPQPKVIQFGQVVTTTYTLANIDAMEKNAAFDGLVIGADYTDPLLGSKHLFDRAFQSYAVDWALVATPLADLRATKFNRFTDNYLRLNGGVPGTVDWFDGWGMKAVEHNWGISARLAKEGGLKGIWLDMETTSGRSIFQWSAQKDYPTTSFAAYQAKVKKFGSILMNALQSYYPNIDLNLTFGYEQAGHQQDGADLTGDRYGLYPSFLDGLYDAARGATTVTNMLELAYAWQRDVDFDYGLFKQVTPPNCASTNYHRVARYGYSLWVDDESDGIHPWDNAVDTNNYNTAAIFETSLGKALSRCGNTGKVEIYNQIPRWWNVTSDDMPQVYRNALVNARATASIEPAFNPTVIPSAKVWLDPGTLSALANTDPISAWTDRIGAAPATQSGGNRPTYVAAAFGSGLPGVKFTAASSQYLNIFSIASIFAGTMDRQMWLCFGIKQLSNSPAAWGYLFGLGTAGAAFPERSWGISSTPRFVSKKVNDTNSSSTFSSSSLFNAPDMTSPHVLFIRENNSLLEFWLDGELYFHTFTVSTSGTTMTGTGFTASLGAGNIIQNAAGTQVTVVSVDSNTSATLSAAFSPDLSSASVKAIQVFTTFTKATTGTFTQARIGCEGIQTPATFDNGYIGDIVLGTGLIETADVIRLQRYVGGRCGATVV